MQPALTPALALDYVRELSADVRAGVVLDADGELLAGPPALAATAQALAEAAGDAAEVEAVSADGVVCAVRSSRHVMVAICGRFALPGVTRQDLRVALAALEAGPPAPPAEARPAATETALAAAADALISAVQRHFGT
jgi:hypothetical protein